MVAQVLGGEGEQWLVKVPPSGQVTYNASAEMDWLRAGMFVEFSANFDSKGQATAPLSQISVFTPSKDRPIGAQADSGLSKAAAELFTTPDPKEAEKPKQESVSLKVAGRITGIRNGKLSVAAGNANVTAELAEKCSILVSVNDASLARADDTVRFSGWRLPNDQVHIYANQLTINAKEPLTGKRPQSESVAAKPASQPKAPATPAAPTQAQFDAALADLENPAKGDPTKK